MADLQGKRIVITRPRSQAEEFARSLQKLGAEAICLPVIEIGPVADTTQLDRAFARLACYDWLVLTSVNGVEAAWERMRALGITGLPPSLKVAAIGPKTAEAIRTQGASPDFTPQEYIAEAILPGLGDLRDRWILLARAELARPALAEAIRRAGGLAHEVTAYRTLPAEADEQAMAALRAGVDIVTFTSSSTVRNFTALVEAAGMDPRRLPGNPIFACIGPITADTARELEFPVGVVAEEYTTEGLVRALLAA